jgi:hypothetical protein
VTYKSSSETPSSKKHNTPQGKLPTPHQILMLPAAECFLFLFYIQIVTLIEIQ